MIETIATWIPRGQCGPWTEGLRVAYMAANIAIFFSYMLLPVSFVVAYKLAPRWVPNRWVLLLCGAFIFTCGVGHLLENVGAFFWPRYDVFTYWHLLTAACSISCTALLPMFVVGLLVPGEEEDGG